MPNDLFRCSGFQLWLHLQKMIPSPAPESLRDISTNPPFENAEKGAAVPLPARPHPQGNLGNGVAQNGQVIPPQQQQIRHQNLEHFNGQTTAQDRNVLESLLITISSSWSPFYHSFTKTPNLS